MIKSCLMLEPHKDEDYFSEADREKQLAICEKAFTPANNDEVFRNMQSYYNYNLYFRGMVDVFREAFDDDGPDPSNDALNTMANYLFVQVSNSDPADNNNDQVAAVSDSTISTQLSDLSRSKSGLDFETTSIINRVVLTASNGEKATALPGDSKDLQLGDTLYRWERARISGNRLTATLESMEENFV